MVIVSAFCPAPDLTVPVGERGRGGRSEFGVCDITDEDYSSGRSVHISDDCVNYA